MAGPLITLTTDFGLSDHCVGVMKGVILGIAPAARIVDITHEVNAYEIAEGAFLIAETYRYFPLKTIHVVVVDPGVGTARRPILVEAAGQRFLAPDNGVLSMVYAREKQWKAREVTASRYFLQPVSSTFHGRDIFAPVAGHLAKGVPPARFGKLIEDAWRTDFLTVQRLGKRNWVGRILKIDRFGNLITNLRAEDFPDVRSRPFEVTVGAEKVVLPARTFADCPPGELALVAGSSGFFEVVANQASAAQRLGVGVGAPVEIMVF